MGLRRRKQRLRQFQRLLDGGKPSLAGTLVRRDPLDHFIVQRLGGGQIGGRGARSQGDPFGQRRLARTRSAQNQDVISQIYALRSLCPGKKWLRPFSSSTSLIASSGRFTI